MTTRRHSPPTTADIIAPPPALYLIALVAGLSLHLLAPWPVFDRQSISMGWGIFFLGSSGIFARWAFITLKQASTSASPRESSTALVKTGPFRFSRNPIYVAMTRLYLGGSLLVNASWPLVLMLPLLLLMHFGVVRREEHYLAAQFGEAYRAYRSRVRRWL